jgi:hypothetical protein
MTFKFYTPYSQIDIDIIETLGGTIQEIYPTLEELIEEEGEYSDYTEIEVEGVMLELNDNNWLYLDDISLN